MKTRLLITILLIVAVSPFAASPLLADDVQLKIPVSSVNNMFNALLKSRYLSYGSIDDGNFVSYYSLKPQSLSLTVQPGNIFSLTIVADAEANFHWEIFNFDLVLLSQSITVTGQVSRQTTGTGYKIAFVPQSIIYNNDNWLKSVINVAATGLISKLPEISTSSNQPLLPTIAAQYFTSGTPTLTTTSTEIVLGLTLSAGPHYITAYNDVNQRVDIGDVQDEEGVNNFVSYSSPKTFEWNTGTTQKLQTPLALLDGSNGKNKYKQWLDKWGQAQPEIAARRIGITVGTQDDEYRALFPQAQHVQLSNLLEGGYSGGTVTYEYSPGVSTTAPTIDDYDFAHPTNTHAINTSVVPGTLGGFWYFQNWSDGNTSQSRSITLNSDVNLQAQYKRFHVSTASAALANTSQRKIVRTDEGYLFLTYESSNRVWLERSDDDGTTWTLCNNNQPIDNGPEAKSPSIDYLTSWSGYDANELFVTYQQKSANGNYTIQLARFNISGQKQSDQTIYTSPSSYTNNATPILAVTWFSTDGGTTKRKQVVGIWKEPAASGVNAGLYWYPAYYVGSTFYWNDPVTKYYQVSYTNGGSANPAIDVYKYDYEGRLAAVYYHCAWEQDAQSIKYQEIFCGYSGVSQAGPYPPTSLSWVLAGNYRPSIIAIANNDARLCWNGYLDDPYDTPPQTIFADPTNPNVFWNLGNNVTSVNMNKYYDDVDFRVGYAVGWTQNSGSGYSSYAAKSTALNSPVNLNTGGKDLQLYNGSDFASMRGVALSTSSPYAFLLSGNVQNGGMQKGTTKYIASGRTAVVSVKKPKGAGADFYFTVGDIAVDGIEIDFPALYDTTRITSDERFFQYLISKPFLLNNSSNFTYGVQYGVADSARAVSAAGKDHFVRFKVELLDAGTGAPIGVFDDVKYDATHIKKHNTLGYDVKTDGIGSRKVQLRLSVATNLTAEYSLGNIIVPAGSALAKDGVVKQQIGYQGSIVVTEYALSQNYPNPFNPATTINYQLPTNSRVTLKVYDVLGREVRTLVNEEEAAGTYSVAFDASHLSSGIYFYQLQAGSFRAVKKMLLTK